MKIDREFYEEVQYSLDLYIDCPECISIDDEQYQCGTCDGTPTGNPNISISSMVSSLIKERDTMKSQLAEKSDRIKEMTEGAMLAGEMIVEVNKQLKEKDAEIKKLKKLVETHIHPRYWQEGR